jgi:hypothetical protein
VVRSILLIVAVVVETGFHSSSTEFLFLAGVSLVQGAQSAECGCACGGCFMGENVLLAADFVCLTVVSV